SVAQGRPAERRRGFGCGGCREGLIARRRVEPPAQCRLQIGGAAYSQPVATGSATGIPAHRAGDCFAALAMTMSPSLRGGRADAAIPTTERERRFVPISSRSRRRKGREGAEPSPRPSRFLCVLRVAKAGARGSLGATVRRAGGGEGRVRRFPGISDDAAGAPEPRRDFLLLLTGALGAVGLASALWPFVDSLEPAADTIAAGAPVDVDLAPVKPGQQITVVWRGRPVWVARRTPEELKKLQSPEDRRLLRDPDSKQLQQPKYAQNWHRSINPEIFVVVGICT